jgi:hypothetical protein
MNWRTKVRIQFWIKARVMAFALTLDAWFFNTIVWLDAHAPRVGDLFCHVRWAFEARVFDPLFAWSYDGSEQEIQDAWEHGDDTKKYGSYDWLSPFQRMIANERILPL